MLDDTGGAKANGRDRQLTTVVEVGSETVETWRQNDLRILLSVNRVPLAV